MLKYWTTLTRTHLIHDAWHLGTPSGIAMAMVAGAVLAFLFEFITLIQYRVITRLHEIENNFQQSTSCNPFVLPRRLLGTFLYIIRVTVVYLLMLCVMSMNVLILVAILVGTGIGFYLKGFFKTRFYSIQNDEEMINLSLQNKDERPNCRNTSNLSEPLLIPKGHCGGSKTKTTTAWDFLKRRVSFNTTTKSHRVIIKKPNRKNLNFTKCSNLLSRIQVMVEPRLKLMIPKKRERNRILIKHSFV